MSKRVFIAEKPSVARQFAEALDESFRSRDGFMESDQSIVTWCVGHLITMCYPDAYDEKYRKWSMDTIPFIPSSYKYQVIDSVKKQFGIVKGILTSENVDTIYICTDSGREGEYIYRLVAEQAAVRGKKQLRVWIDSQTKEEILRGIREAKDDSEYDNLGAAAYLRAKEDYLMGINFSRALTLRYGYTLKTFLNADRCVIAVGRVMTCVLGMIVSREREIRGFEKTSFYRPVAALSIPSADPSVPTASFKADWHTCDSSVYKDSPKLYKDNGFQKEEDAFAMIEYLRTGKRPEGVTVSPDRKDEDGTSHFAAGQSDAAGIPSVDSVTRKKENKRAPLLYNLAELQNDCSRYFKISPDQTLEAAQELYEKKLTTYPRTDARVLSSAVAKEITRNLNGLFAVPMYKPYIKEIASLGTVKNIGKTRYTDDKAITDHYAIIPTGDGLHSLASCSSTVQKVYELITRRFLSIFYPPAVFDKISMQVRIRTELFSASVKTCKEEGYLKVLQYSFFKERKNTRRQSDASVSEMSGPDDTGSAGNNFPDESEMTDRTLSAAFEHLRKGMRLGSDEFLVKTGETKPPSRYNSGSMILAMENAGQLIEDDELREQIRGSGIGTSATRAEILKKLQTNRYIYLARKTQIITPTQLGEMIYDTVSCSLKPLLEPKLTASWEKGLSGVAEGTVSEEEYIRKLTGFVERRTNHVKNTDYRDPLQQQFRAVSKFYPEKGKASSWNQTWNTEKKNTESKKKKQSNKTDQ